VRLTGLTNEEGRATDELVECVKSMQIIRDTLGPGYLANLKEFYFTVFIVNKYSQVTSYRCDTRLEWLESAQHINSNESIPDPGTSASFSFFSGEDEMATKWPNGVVKYRIHPSVSKTDLIEVKKAFHEIVSKTCARFETANSTDKYVVNIMVDNSVCGRAHVCISVLKIWRYL